MAVETKAGWIWAVNELDAKIEGGGGDITVTWDDVEDKPTTFPAAWADITGVPAALTTAQAAGTASIRALGTSATTAAAGNHTHVGTAVTLTGYAIGTVALAAVAPTDTVNAAIAKLEKRIADLEAA